jgi:radical SAM superfamily enzyme YgiQ (UPF0313 family)
VTRNVCLIIPPSPFLLDERVFPSLGVLRVAAALEANGTPVTVLDLSGVADYECVVEAAVAGDPTVTHYGVTATTPQMHAAGRIAARLREVAPGRRTILGGPHVTMLNAASRRERVLPIGRAARQLQALARMFDVLVAGNGERAMRVALHPECPPFLDADDPRSPFWLTAEELARWPARHLLDLETYVAVLDGARSTSVVAQLGCPFGCGFCSGRASPTFRRVRTRDVAGVVAEVEHLHRTWGYTGFMFQDDELNVSGDVVALMDALADLQARLGVAFRLRGFLKAQLFTDAQAAALARAGFMELLIGFESGSERILENINKRATVTENTRCFEIAARRGLGIKALMSLGHPGETEGTVRATWEWLLAMRPQQFDVTIITVYPGSPYFDEAVETGDAGVYCYTARSGDVQYQLDIDPLADTPYYKGVPGQYRAFVWTPGLGRAALCAVRDEMEADVRAKLSLPYYQARGVLASEHSMGQSA